ncbi:prephenate dehydratase [Aureispira sp. CCB-QB1]|uniref:prephenate dehydratase n=1 Tax=Aureispira sp. CCB-QB1 TaxID=1313421 RepID=UPI0006976217|nr:prephenate dehydratase domain-containing protein [Aureispira sp. CCB-QB1]
MKTIAILGTAASFHEIAAKHYYQESIKIIPCKTPKEVLQEVKQNPNCEGGILAIENTIAGSVTNHYNSLQDLDICIRGELLLNIQHHLVALPKTSIYDIWEIRTHPMAIKQCSNYLARIHPATRLLACSDTASAAKEISQQHLKGVAAIASSLASSYYGLEILASNIQNNKNNYTRFFILSKSKQGEQKEHNKATIIFRLDQKAERLSSVLLQLQALKINLSKLHSFPLGTISNTYEFIADLEFNNFSCFQKSLMQLEKVTLDYSVLGTYQKATTPLWSEIK